MKFCILSAIAITRGFESFNEIDPPTKTASPLCGEAVLVGGPSGTQNPKFAHNAVQ